MWRIYLPPLLFFSPGRLRFLFKQRKKKKKISFFFILWLHLKRFLLPLLGPCCPLLEAARGRNLPQPLGMAGGGLEAGLAQRRAARSSTRVSAGRDLGMGWEAMAGAPGLPTHGKTAEALLLALSKTASLLVVPMCCYPEEEMPVGTGHQRHPAMSSATALPRHPAPKSRR